MRSAVRRIGAVLLTVVVMLSGLLASPRAYAATSFSDVPAGAQFHDEIIWLADQGVVKGYPDGTYHPLESVTRDAMAAFLYRMAGSPAYTAPAASPFTDVSTTQQFYKEMSWLASEGISKGWPDGTFRPFEPVARDAMAAFLYRFAGSPSYTAPATSPFTDVATTQQFYKEMSWLASKRISTGWPDGTFRPFEPVARDAMAAFLYRLKNGGPAPEPEPQPVNECTASTPLASRPMVRSGDHGSCVAELQRLLTLRGFSVASDGSFGLGTEIAVRRFQSSKLGMTIDGIVGRGTWDALMNNTGANYSIYTGPNTSKRVVLTYDDCPTSLTAFKNTVDAARDLGMALVLAPTGNCISAGRFDAAYARAAGHYVINHSVTHPELTKLTRDAVVRELKAPGIVTTFGRPPFGAINETVRDAYALVGMRIWLWNIDTNDWSGPKTQSQVVSYVNANATAGSTVLMHMQHQAFNASALTSMKSGLAARGLEVCRNNGATPVSPKTVNC